MYMRTWFLKRGVFLRKEPVQIFMLENKIFAQIIKKRFLQKYNLTF